ncbi:hypothetical protein IF1G_00523 [Cordyceps javanica]|uniref:Uncharacterized protein n=1 Tax=Cordyceps javanica TaxID=43265 RepID=A0A545VFU9_9HYPO|nr:hypothetical protein IF1G_00523 [Cordyceps javanica]
MTLGPRSLDDKKGELGIAMVWLLPYREDKRLNVRKTRKLASICGGETCTYVVIDEAHNTNVLKTPHLQGLVIPVLRISMCARPMTSERSPGHTRRAGLGGIGEEGRVLAFLALAMLHFALVFPFLIFLESFAHEPVFVFMDALNITSIHIRVLFFGATEL